MLISKNLSDETTDDELNLETLLLNLLDHRWFIIIITSIFLIIGIIYAECITPIYTSNALIQVQSKNSPLNLDSLFAQDPQTQTQIQILKSRMILGKTVDQMNLTTIATPKYLPIIGSGLARLFHKSANIQITQFTYPINSYLPSITLKITDSKLGSYDLLKNNKIILSGTINQLSSQSGYTIFVSQLSGTTGQLFTISHRSYLSSISTLQSQLNISEDGTKSGILTLSLQGSNPSFIQQVLQNICQNYFLQNIQENSLEAQQSLAFLQKSLPDVKSKLIDAENALNIYRQSSDSLNLEFQAKNALDSLVKVDQQLNQLSFQESEMAQRFTKSYPGYIALIKNRQILLLTKSKLENSIKNLPAAEKKIISLKRGVEVNQHMYMQILNKIQELNIVKAGTIGNVRIIDNALSYPHPIKPKKPLLVILFLIIGLIISSLIVLIRSVLNKGVKTPDEIESIGLPVYATIPESKSNGLLHKKSRSKNSENALLAIENPADLSIEALRNLRTTLHFSMMEAKNKAIMITGPSPSVGKSFISSNLSCVLSILENRVLLIDADMRRGKLNKVFDLSKQNGLSTYLSGSEPLSAIIKNTTVNNLDLITSGDFPPNPSELLMHPRFIQLIEWANDNYDYIIIDTPPVLAVTDAMIIGKHAGTTILIGKFEQTSQKEIKITVNKLERVGININGFVLNYIVKKLGSYNSEQYGYYQYSYKEDK